METTTHRIKIKLGEAEFDAEGPSDVVNAQFSAFLEAISKATPKVAQTPAPTKNSPDLEAEAAVNSRVGAASNALGLTSDILTRVFKVNDTVSLLALPKTDKADADALLAILYGFDRMKSVNTVTGTTLMKAAKQSGISIDRIDRVISGRGALVNMAGAKKGRRYSLNNRGVAAAEKIIREMIE